MAGGDQFGFCLGCPALSGVQDASLDGLWPQAGPERGLSAGLLVSPPIQPSWASLRQLPQDGSALGSGKALEHVVQLVGVRVLHVHAHAVKSEKAPG